MRNIDSAETPCIVGICGDPGGASAVAPVIEMLHADKQVNVRALAYGQAGPLWKKRGLQYEEIPEDITLKDIADLLVSRNTSLLLTGTSFNSIDLEKKFIKVARQTGLSSLAVLDFWSNYSQRFSDENGQLVFLPDWIAVMDEMARDEMMEESIPSKRLVITGQPAFDNLALCRSLFTADRRNIIRDGLVGQPHGLLVLFASQPFSELYGIDQSNQPGPGFDEWQVLEILISALEEIAGQNNRNIALAIRPHPRERGENFVQVKSRVIDIVVVEDVESRELVMAADLVVGMNSVLLVEACFLGCITVSLQPGLNIPDPLPTNKSGYSYAVYEENQAKAVLGRLLIDDQARTDALSKLTNLALPFGATRKVVDLAYQINRGGKGQPSN